MGQAENTQDNAGKGLALPGLLVGLLTGLAVYGVVEYWIDGADNEPLAITALFFIVTAAAAYLLLAETDGLLKAAGGALIVAALLILPDYTMSAAAADESRNLSNFPPIFWFLSRILVAYLLVTLVKSSLEQGAPPPYRDVFFHGLTIPLIAGGANLFAGLALVLLFAWALLLKEMDVEFFNRVFQEPWFIFPFLGAVGGLSVALMRGQQAVLGALRFILVLFCRIVMPITAAFTVTFLSVLIFKGAGAFFEWWRPSVLMIGLALAGMLIFNGVYQNGEGAPPPAWLRLPTLVTLIGFPVYTGLAFYALMLRIGEYGLTPARIAGLAIAGLVAAYSIVCIAGLLSELNWRARRWMAPVAPLNTGMAALWIVVLTALATPLINSWALSAQSQYMRLAKERVAAEEFDFGYLRFELGRYGDKALDKLLALDAHPETAAIRAGVERARAAKSRWEYDNPELAPDRPEEEDPSPSDAGPMGLELNPEGADTGADDPDAARQDETDASK